MEFQRRIYNLKSIISISTYKLGITVIIITLMISQDAESGTTTTWHPYTIIPRLGEKRHCNLCPNVYFPICTSNNKTYINICQFNCEERAKDEKVVRRGVCIYY